MAAELAGKLSAMDFTDPEEFVASLPAPVQVSSKLQRLSGLLMIGCTATFMIDLRTVLNAKKVNARC